MAAIRLPWGQGVAASPTSPPVRLAQRVRRCLKGSSGQALVETAVALPLILTLLAAAVDGGQMMAATASLSNAAAAAAKVAAQDVAQGDPPGQVQADAAQAAAAEGAPLACSGLDLPEGCVVVAAVTGPGGTPMEQVTVYDTPTLLVPFGPGVTVRALAAAAP
jgi:Flp pilus assembly protein TadG